MKPTTLHAVSSLVMFLGSIVIAVLFAYLTTIVVKTANSSWAFFNRTASVKEQVRACISVTARCLKYASRW